jgi:hypothetical protein
MLSDVRPVRAGIAPAWKVLFGRRILASFPLARVLRTRASVLLTGEGVVTRSWRRTRCIGWDRVVGGRFGYDEDGRWALALDLTPGEEAYHEVVLLTIDPVRRPVSSPQEMHRRDLLIAVQDTLHSREVAVTMPVEIREAMYLHWGMFPPSGPESPPKHHRTR